MYSTSKKKTRPKNSTIILQFCVAIFFYRLISSQCKIPWLWIWHSASLSRPLLTIWVPGIPSNDNHLEKGTWLKNELKNIINLYCIIISLLFFACCGGYFGDPGVEDDLFQVRMLFPQRKPIHWQVVRPAVFTVDRNTLGNPRLLIALHNDLLI